LSIQGGDTSSGMRIKNGGEQKDVDGAEVNEVLEYEGNIV
jgi:hypothetical protein